MRFNFGRLMRQHCLQHADAPALVNIERNRRYTFREYHRLTNRIANMMRTTFGLGRGDTAAFVLENDSLSLVHHLMVLKQESACAYCNYRDSLEEHLWQVDHIKAKAVFVEAAAMRQVGPSRLKAGGSTAWMSFMVVAMPLPMPGQHVAGMRWPVSAPVEEAVIEVRVDMMRLDEPHEMDGVSAGGETAVGLEYVGADRFGAGEALVADTDHASTMFSCRYPVRHNVG